MRNRGLLPFWKERWCLSSAGWLWGRTCWKVPLAFASRSARTPAQWSCRCWRCEKFFPLLPLLSFLHSTLPCSYRRGWPGEGGGGLPPLLVWRISHTDTGITSTGVREGGGGLNATYLPHPSPLFGLLSSSHTHTRLKLSSRLFSASVELNTVGKFPPPTNTHTHTQSVCINNGHRLFFSTDTADQAFLPLSRCVFSPIGACAHITKKWINSVGLWLSAHNFYPACPVHHKTPPSPHTHLSSRAYGTEIWHMIHCCFIYLVSVPHAGLTPSNQFI